MFYAAAALGRRWWWCWPACRIRATRATIVRSAEAFGATGVVALPGTVSMWNPKAVRASAGSVFRVPRVAASVDECFTTLREAGARVLSPPAMPRSHATWWSMTGPIAIVIGNEGNGVPDAIAARADERVTDLLPRAGGEPERRRGGRACCCMRPPASARRRPAARGALRGSASMSLFDGEPETPRVSSNGMPTLAQARHWPSACARARWMNTWGRSICSAPGKPLRVQIERDGRGTGELGSMIFWGPPGVGKTTLAKIIAETTQANFIEFSAVLSGIKEIKQVMAAAAQAAELHSRTILIRG